MTDKTHLLVQQARKLSLELYKDDPDPATDALNGAILLRTVQYVMFDYIYKIDPDNPPTMENLAHFMALRPAFGMFFKRWEKLVKQLKTNVRKQILRQCGNDETHKLLDVYDWVCSMQELHIRMPKINPSRAGVCYNCVDNTVCEFQKTLGRKKRRYTMLVFTPLPSDSDYRVLDPNERSERFNIELLLQKVNDNVQAPYDVSEQFCCVVTRSWGKLFRLLHNIFHLHAYINIDVLQEIYRQRKLHLEELPWTDVWLRLVGNDFQDASIDKFHKGKDTSRTVVSITQIYNIVTAALELFEHSRDK